MILAFDTSGAACATCLMDPDGVAALSAIYQPMVKGHVERLFPILEDTLAKGGATWADLTRIGVGVGPGNFTGIRISVASARGLALSLGVPAIGVSALEAAAFGQTAPVYSTVSANLSHVYWQGFGTPDTGIHFGPQDNVPDDFPRIGAMGNEIAPYGFAESIARIAATRSDTAPPKPLYVRAADAAPPRDAPPVILD
ncbi:tRNA (adenosine(37)-N6)-threonylcarbamoyltransferase complex dimerization subunit type 1 TsaB [Nereida sp. MMG025]|uniref:tRNA (adenosine(37)-N6)-threonylcarbamoyltransferase complex dimerization subunit type 1 TsaB n=1 Tax=Nereida sp. MMG025 TaxID=2909981 RepID=UPI001F02ABDC|nr:tRNA (adenosine(37)-N6)-threonylcarbamoyltransferase complex dimerization subunit type 1 TsaB [Nereida sp. MMG025]MCF6445530.1 tRNA (adenosine(37)-N6)-threonylcarbamoyltransferase complex dimerization subunit type 1 TsaB [Nereida sp. MMG025]